MTMISGQAVREIFEQYIPDVVELAFVDKDTFIREAMLNPFIAEQMRIGIYDENNIHEDFLTVAKAYSLLRRVEICLELIQEHVADLDENLTIAYVHWHAAHEAHHFEDPHMLPANDPRAQALHEKSCNDLVSERYPRLEKLMEQIELTSPTYQRVYKRIEEINARRREAHTK
jgi:hypothetical protein